MTPILWEEGCRLYYMVTSIKVSSISYSLWIAYTSYPRSLFDKGSQLRN